MWLRAKPCSVVLEVSKTYQQQTDWKVIAEAGKQSLAGSCGHPDTGTEEEDAFRAKAVGLCCPRDWPGCREVTHVSLISRTSVAYKHGF